MKYIPLWSNDVEKRIRNEATNLDTQARPATIRMCARCVMTNQRPRILFDEDGICSACRYAERKRSSIDWTERRKQLEAALLFHDRVVVPASGGKDSSFVAWTLRNLKVTPLLARWAPHITTEIGERNWQALLHSGFDGITAQPNGLLHRKLSRLALEYYGDPFLPFIYGQLAWPMHVAVQNKIRLVFFGENGEAEYGGDQNANDKRCWEQTDWERVYMKGGSCDKLANIGITLGAITRQEWTHASKFYKTPPDILETDTQFHWLGYYLPWHPQGNYYHAAEQTGFEANEDRSEGTYSRYASIDDKLDGLHYWFGYLKFGIGRCTSDAAHEIRDGELTRDEALALVEKYDAERPVRHLHECLDYLGMTEEQFEKVENRFRTHPIPKWSPKTQETII